MITHSYIVMHGYDVKALLAQRWCSYSACHGQSLQEEPHWASSSGVPENFKEVP